MQCSLRKLHVTMLIIIMQKFRIKVHLIRGTITILE